MHTYSHNHNHNANQEKLHKKKLQITQTITNANSLHHLTCTKKKDKKDPLLTETTEPSTPRRRHDDTIIGDSSSGESLHIDLSPEVEEGATALPVPPRDVVPVLPVRGDLGRPPIPVNSVPPSPRSPSRTPKRPSLGLVLVLDLVTVSSKRHEK